MAGRQLAQQRLRSLYEAFITGPDRLPDRFRQRIEQVGTRRATVDYLAGMTDHYCLEQFQRFSDRAKTGIRES